MSDSTPFSKIIGALPDDPTALAAEARRAETPAADAALRWAWLEYEVEPDQHYGDWQGIVDDFVSHGLAELYPAPAGKETT